MRIVLLFLIVLTILGFNTGCQQHGDYQYEIAVVDNLQISLDEVVLDYKKWDMDSLKNLKISMDNELNYLSNLLKNSKDTLSRKDGLFLGEYKTASRTFKRMEDNHAKFIKEIDISNKQLASLKKDLQNGAMSDMDTVQLYLTSEKKSVNTLIQGLSRINDIYKVGADKYKKMNPRVTHILDSLTLRNNN